jgi:hypothetical protein
MSKRCKLQSEYFKKHGNYKGVGKYSDSYVNWLEDKIISLKENMDSEIDEELLDQLEKRIDEIIANEELNNEQ